MYNAGQSLESEVIWNIVHDGFFLGLFFFVTLTLCRMSRSSLSRRPKRPHYADKFLIVYAGWSFCGYEALSIANTLQVPVRSIIFYNRAFPTGTLQLLDTRTDLKKQ